MTFRDEAELASALEALRPEPRSLPVMEMRVRQAQHSIFAEAGRILQVAFGFGEGTVSIRPVATRSRADGRSGSFGREHVTIQVESPEERGRVDELTFRGRDCRPNAVAALFAGTLHAAISAALATVESSRGLHDVSPEDCNRSFEMLVLSMEEWTTVAFLRLFIEEPAPPPARAGYRPFHDTFLPAKALEQWVRRVPGSTFEGSSLQTGIVLEASIDTARAPGTVLFSTPIPLTEALASKQDLVMADGKRSFLLLRKDMQVHGATILPSAVDLDYLEGSETGDVDASMVDRLWIQVVDHQRLAIHGTMRNGSLIHVADVEQGGLRLRDPRAELDIAAAAIESVVAPEVKHAARPLLLSLLRRTGVGRGGGLVVGEQPAEVSVRRPVQPGFCAASAPPAWLSLLNPDGTALLSRELEVTGVGCFIESIAGNRARGLGTRHAALAKATEGRRNVGIAISDDGTLTVYQHGRAVVRLG